MLSELELSFELWKERWNSSNIDWKKKKHPVLPGCWDIFYEKHGGRVLITVSFFKIIMTTAINIYSDEGSLCSLSSS